MIWHMKQERPGVTIVMHHLNPGCSDYELWDPVVPMYTDDHSRLHLSLIDHLHTSEAHSKRLLTLRTKPLVRSKETRQKTSKSLLIFNKSSKSVEVNQLRSEKSKKMWEESSREKRDNMTHKYDKEVNDKKSKSLHEYYQNHQHHCIGTKLSKERCLDISVKTTNSWTLRREKYGPTGRRSRKEND